MRSKITVLLLSIFTLFLCIYLFVNFNNYKNNSNFKIGENVLLDENTLICKDTDHKFDCQKILTQNKLVKYDNFKNNVYITKNALICDDTDNINSCVCLTNECNYYKNLFEPIQRSIIIKNQMTFSPNNGLYYTGRSLPTSSNNSFSLTFFIKIDKLDVDFNRNIIFWDNFKLSLMPYKTECSSKLFLQLYSLYEDGIFSNSCVGNMTYYEWNHFVIQGSDDTIEYYFNGELMETIKLYKNYELGNVDKYFIVGENCPGISLSNLYWFNNKLSANQIKYLQLDFSLTN